MKIRVRVAPGEGSETTLMKLAGFSAVAHVVGLAAFSILPHLMSSPPPRVSMVAEIVPASALFPPAPPAGSPNETRPPAPTPSQRAEEARKAQEPPAKKPPEKAPPKTTKKDPTVPPLESRKEDKKKKEPEKPPAAAEVGAKDEDEAPPGKPQETEAIERKSSDPGGGVSLGSTTGFDASGVPTLGSSAFPYDYYRSSLMSLLQSNWRRPVVTDTIGEPLRCGIGFTILKTGIVKDAHIADPSGNAGLDRSALRAVIDSNPLPPLPFQYGHDAVSAIVYFKLTED